MTVEKRNVILFIGYQKQRQEKLLKRQNWFMIESLSVICLKEVYDTKTGDQGISLQAGVISKEWIFYKAINRFLSSQKVAIIKIDTQLDINNTGLRSSAEIESPIARIDVVVTTWLHGAVFALKNGVPVVAIDPEAGGAKIKHRNDITLSMSI